MRRQFQHRLHQALADANLQAALDANAERRLSARQAAISSLTEELPVLRRRLHELRRATIAGLDGYLEQFIARAQANGMVVHIAANASQAAAAILEIARQHGARTIVKSKTMLGEEIELNPALEAEGLQVIETDLGEYIVQLRGEPPAHIITPAVHLRREDVARLFADRLGMPYTTDIPVMTAVARQTLRQAFLEADIGISGVNMAVAETGTLCILTNEGNGRMVSTLPPVHIALMGMERLVPKLADLASVLELLPRSATGQKITVYASLIHGPRRPGEMDGPLERHVVLVDNGRLAMRGSPLEEALYCIRCGACLNACPVFRELGGHTYASLDGKISAYPGPIGSVLSPAFFGAARFGHLPRLSSLCGACQEACPVDIPLPRLLLRLRAGKLADRPVTDEAAGNNKRAPQQAGADPAMAAHIALPLRLGLVLFSWFASSAWRFDWLQRLAAFFSQLISPASSWLRLPAWTGWGLGRDFPRPASQSFRRRWRDIGAQSAALERPAPPASNSPALPTKPTSPMPEPDLLARFAAELHALGANFVQCGSGQLPTHILALLKDRHVEVVQAWDEPEMPAGLLEALRSAGIQVVCEPDPNIRVGLTGASAACADTGSLLLTLGRGRPATASLLPEVHLAILRRENLLPNLVDLLSHPSARHSSAAVLISGPSRTADIEMTLTIGVHGPGELFVFCID